MTNANAEAARIYVAVEADFDENGAITPRELTWSDGRRYEIDRVLDVRPAAARKAGGQGDRYTIRVRGQTRYLFFERSANLNGANIGRWFVEGARTPNAAKA